MARSECPLSGNIERDTGARRTSNDATIHERPHGHPAIGEYCPLNFRSMRSVHADRLELLAPRVDERSFARIGEHDRCAIGRMQRE